MEKQQVSIYAYPGCCHKQKIQKSSTFDFEKALNDVCEVFGQKPEEVKKSGRNRHREFVIVKQTVMSLAKLKSTMSLTSIGNQFGRDHATVLHSVKTVKNLMETSRDYRGQAGHLFAGLEFPHFKN